MSAINSDTTETPAPTPEVNLHGRFFLSTTFLVFSCEGVIFRLPLALLSRRLPVIQDMLEFVGDDVVVDEGTVEKPLELHMPVNQFEAVCKLLFDGEVKDTFKPEELLNLYKGCQFLQYEEGLVWARRRYTHARFELDPFEKLVQGIILSETSWIIGSLRDNFYSGRLPLPKPSQGHILSDNGCSWVIMVITNGNNVYESNAKDCLDTPPKPDSSRTWCHPTCQNHQACLQAVQTGWKMIRKRMRSEICPPQGIYCLLSFREYISAAPFPRMHNECRQRLIDDISDRAETLHEEILLAITLKIEAIADKEAERARDRAVTKEMAAKAEVKGPVLAK